jgi:hypothetical protein
MEKLSTHRRNASLMGGFGLMASPLVALGTPAFASTADCTAVDPSATEVSAGVCEIQFVDAGDFSIAAPSGVAKMSAVLVGGGGGHTSFYGEYAGGGGSVVYVASVNTSAPIEVTVGEGVDGAVDAGGASSVNSDEAAGGFSGNRDGTTGCACGGYSGNGNAGWLGVGGAGGGAGGSAIDIATGGLGRTASAVANDAEMWPALPGEPAYGPGGLFGVTVTPVETAGAGAPSDGSVGNDGLVILRWTYAGLANTGLTTWNIALGAMFAAGLFFVAFGSLSARNKLRFAGSRERLVGLLKDANDRLSREDSSRRDDVS